MELRALCLAGVGCLLLAGCATGSPPGAAVSSARASTGVALASPPCGHPGQPPASYRHVVLIVEENKPFGAVVGSADAPFLNQLAARCGLATNYRAVAHPSLPNYIALTSGSTHGITDDAGPAAHPLAGPSLFSQLHGNWRALEESMPVPCDLVSAGDYAVKHDPAAYYTDLRPGCRSRILPLGPRPDLSAAFTLITPDLQHDMHDGTVAQGDAWLAGQLPAILASPQYLSGRTVVLITWDEGGGGDQRVATLVLAPTTPAGLRVGAAFTHYSLLRTVEELLGLPRQLGAAATATSMARAFHL